MSRRWIAVALLGFAAGSCGEGGPAPINLSTGAELAGIFGPRYEVARVRIAERPRSGIDETAVTLEQIASRCRTICASATCFTPDVDRCTENCTRDTSRGPPSCALPVLDALICAIDAVCALPVDQRMRAGERFAAACSVELSDLGAVQAGTLPGTELCDFPEL